MPGLLSDLSAEQFHIIAITDLHIAQAPHIGYKPYDTGKALLFGKSDAFVKQPDRSDYVGKV